MPKRNDIFSLLLSSALSACVSTGFPDRDAILTEALACGLSEANLTFFVDEEGIDNAEVHPLTTDEEGYMDKLECLVAWAGESGAAIGFHFQPRSEQ